MLGKLNLWIKNKLQPLPLFYEFFFYRRKLTRKDFFIDHLVSNLKLFKYSLVYFFGRSVRLEASSICQLRCPACSTGKRLNKKGIIGWGTLKFEDFKKFVDENPQIRHIELSNYGEIFLNRNLRDIIQYSYDKKISLTAGNGVNLNNISEEMIETLVKYKFKHLLVSIDGASNETYKIYRIGGNFDRVIDNIKRINNYKRKYNSRYPKLTWQFVIFGHNEHELPLAKKMTKELGMEFLPKLNHSPHYSPVRNEESVRKFTEKEVISRDEFKKKYKKNYLNPCGQLWFSPQINWDGKLLGCCVNKTVDFGNVFEKGLKECLKSEKYVYTKKMVLGKVKAREDIPCYNCNYYDNPEKEEGNLQIITLVEKGMAVEHKKQ